MVMDALDETLTDLGGKPTLGGNNPPPLEVLRDELEAASRDLLFRADMLLDALLRMKQAETYDDATKVADYARMVKACQDAAERARVARKDPYLTGGRTIDNFYGSRLADPLDNARLAAVENLKRFLAANPEVEEIRGDAGSLVTRRLEWRATNVDKATLDLDALRPHLGPDAIAKALRAYIQHGGRKIAGATIEETIEVTIR